MNNTIYYAVMIVILVLACVFMPATTVSYENPNNDPYSSILGVTTEKPELRDELKPICACESSYEGTKYGKPRQFNPDGSVRLGIANSDDTGMCQINLYWHGEQAKSLGYDLFTEDGNILFANWLYEREGLAPWSWSKKCWTE